MSATTPQQITPEENLSRLPTSPVQKAIRLLLMLAVVGAFAGAIYWKESSRARGGAIAFDAIVKGAMDSGTDLRKVPGRDNEVMDRADVWRIDLRAGETVTINSCASRSGNRAGSSRPSIVVQGPSTSDPPVEDSTAPRPTQNVMVFTPRSTGQHSIWVYKTRNQTPFSYQLQVLRGARPDPGYDICYGSF